MLLSARVLNDVASVNSFEYASNVAWMEGDATTLYFQLIDASLDTDMAGFNPSGRRYMPATGATLSVQLQNIDDAKVVNRTATQPFAGDASIWSIQILATDALHGMPQMLLTLVEPDGLSTKTTRGLVKNGIKIFSTSNVGC